MKCIFGVEAYYVDDRFEKDRSNWHLILIALNINGFNDINRIISEANTTGYYYKPRIDKELLLSLNSSNVIVTTACVAGRLFKTENYKEEFVLPVKNHFKENFYLEVQSHKAQADYNKKIIDLSQELNISIIHANDSHYIYPEDSKYRTMFLNAKGLNYPEEDNFILDYPDTNTIIKRYQEQGVLSDKQIEEALNNTLIFDKCEDLNFTTDIKLPKVIKGDSNEYLKKIITEEWNKKKKDIPKEKHKECMEAIRYETSVVCETGMADYFIDDYLFVKRGKEVYHGILTPTGRGSAVSYLINNILGFTEVNRILNNAIPLYPSRFMSKARILQTKSLPDIDLNMQAQEPFLQATKDILGEDGVYYMISYKPLQESSAFRLWCKALGMKIDEYNEVGKNLDKYINDEKWKQIIEDSKVFRGVIESVSPSPCSFLLLDKSISKETGLIRVGEENKKEYKICTCMDKISADHYKYLKNDYLIISTLDQIVETCKLAKIKMPTLMELEQLVDDKTWKIYEKGLTAMINQVDSEFSTPLAMKYKPHSIEDMAKFVAAIRPGFSMLNSFLERQKYSTGVPQIDKLLSNSDHYILFQENIMQFLIYCGIEEDLTYGIIKAISKKKMKEKEFKELKEKVRNGYIKKIGSENGFEDVWKAMESASKYSFNSSHALSYAYDSIYEAYLKSHYPLEFYTVALNLNSEDINKTSKIISELSYFNIKVEHIKFRFSQSVYSCEKETNSIYKGIGSIKYLNEEAGKDLYKLRKNKYDKFTDLLIDIEENTSANSKQTKILIKLNFFSEFGKNKKLLDIYELFQKRYKKTHKEKTKIERIKEIKEFEDISEDKNITVKEQLEAEYDNLGYAINIYPKFINKGFIVDIDTKYSPKVTIYHIDTGKEKVYKVYKNTYKKQPLEKYDIIEIGTIGLKNKSQLVNGEWKKIEDKEAWLEGYKKLN